MIKIDNDDYIIPNNPDIISMKFFKNNLFKISVYYVLNVLLLFIPMFIFHLIPDL